MDVAVTLLGGFAVTVNGSTREPGEWRRRQAAALVKLLAQAPNLTLHREQVMDALWPDLSVDDAAPRLHKAAHYARKATGEPASVVLAGESVALFPERNVRVDAREFESLADAALSKRDPLLAGRAAEAYTGEFLPQDRYETWAQETRDRLHLLYLDVLRLAGRWETLSIVDPTDEEAHLRVIGELTKRGQRRAALRQFERLERALRQELGVAPSASAARLRAQLLAAQMADIESPDITEAEHELPSPVLVGSDNDRALLTRLLDTVQSGAGRTVFIGGPAGIGKTALSAWLERTAAERRMRVGSGIAAHIAGAWPYAPVLEAIADLCRRHPTLLDGLDDSLKAEIESGLTGREVHWTAQSGHQRLFVAAAELLRLAAAGAGAMLLVDDAHNADEPSLRLMHYLARSTLAERVVLVFAHRPESSPGLAHVQQNLLGRGAALALDLKPLDYQAVSTLTRRLSPEASDEFVDAVWNASEGLPLSVLELTRTKGAGDALAAPSWLPVALTDSHARACAAAAVLGNAFDTDEFVHATGLAEDDAYDVLDSVLAQRVLVRTDTGYRFRHAMLREALLNRLRPSQLRGMHQQAAAALETLDRAPSRIGHHLLEAGDKAAAVPWMLRAAESSAALGANQEALANLETVRDFAQGEDLARLLSLRAELLTASADAGAVDAYRDALGVATDPAEQSRLRARLASAAMIAGDLETAAVALEGLVPDGSPADADLLLAQGNLAVFQGDLEAADAAASAARRRVTLDRPPEWQAFELVGLQGLLAHNRGEWFQQLRLELRSGAGRPAFAARIFDSHLCVAEFLLYGPTPYAEVLELAAELRVTAERSGVLRAVAFATALRGETALLMGDLELAESELQEAALLHRDIGSSAGEAHSLQRLAEVKLWVGDRAEANRLLHRALPIARFSSIGRHLLQRIYGTLIQAAQEPAAARTMVDQAQAALAVNDNCPFCDIMLAVPAARACADVGDLEAAQRCLRRAENSVGWWEGTAWQAAILEAKAHLAAAMGDARAADELHSSAADLFDASGQPLDARRCRTATLAPQRG